MEKTQKTQTQPTTTVVEMDVFGKPASAEHLIKAFAVCRRMIRMSKHTIAQKTGYHHGTHVYGLLGMPIFGQLSHCLGALLDLIR